MNPSQSVRIQLVDEQGDPVRQGGVYLSIGFFTSGEYRFGFRSHGTDDDGSVAVSYEDMERARQINLKYQLMDFNTPLDDCDPEISIRVPGNEEMQNAEKSVHRYNATELFEASNGWIRSANEILKADERRVTLEVGINYVELVCSKCISG